MHAIWDRLGQLGLASVSTVGAAPTVAVLLHRHIEGFLADAVPERFKIAACDWLSWQHRTALLSRAAGAASDAELRLPLDDGCDVIASPLSASSLSLGVLVGRVPCGSPPPWPTAASRHLAHVLAAELAPLLVRALEQERSFREGVDLLQLQLQRQGSAGGDVALLGNERLTEHERAFQGVAHVEGVGMPFLGRVRGGASPAGFVPVVMTLFGRWLRDIPDPDPSTVIDAVHTDLLEVLEPLRTEIEATVIVPGPGRVQVSTTDTLVAVVGPDGTIIDRASPDEVTVAGGRLGIRRTEELIAPAGSSVVAIGGLADLATLRALMGAAGGASHPPLSFASQLRSQIARRTTLSGGVLVHPLATSDDGAMPPLHN